MPRRPTFKEHFEKVTQKPTWRFSVCDQSCLMPARGWYEWNENELVRNDAGRKVKQPYFISTPDS